MTGEYLWQVNEVVPDQAVYSLDVVAQLLAALGEAARDLLGGPHVSVHAGVLQQLQHTQVRVAVPAHHLQVLVAHAGLHDVTVQQAFHRLYHSNYCYNDRSTL